MDSDFGFNVAKHLAVAARSRPDAMAVVDQSGTTWTNQRLHDESDRSAAILRAAGVERGMRCVVMVPPSLPFFSLTFALFKLAAVPILIDPGMGIRGLGRCIADAEPAAFIGVRKALWARILFGWGRQTVRLTVPVGRNGLAARSPDSLNSDFAPAWDVKSSETAAILFTSGSTGPAKGAIYTHGMFAAQVEAIRRLFGIQPGEIDLCTFPLFALFAPALGMTAIIPAMDATRPARVSPSAIFAPVREWGVTNLFGSPALLNTISRAAEAHSVALPSLRRVVSAGAPVPATVIERVTKMLASGVPVYTPYGATECLPVACISSGEILGETRHRTDEGKGICVGRPVPEVDLAIIPVTDDPIEFWSDALRQPVGVVGEITVRGPFVSPGYYNRPDATRLAKIRGPNGELWHRMGDLGYWDASGRVWFCGRKAHRVWTAAGPLDTIPCEAVFNTHPTVFRTALVGVGPRGRQTPVLCVELEPAARTIDRTGLTRQLLEIGRRYPHTLGIRTILYHRGFPVDVRHNAKIGREKLARWAERRLQ